MIIYDNYMTILSHQPKYIKIPYVSTKHGDVETTMDGRRVSPRLRPASLVAVREHHRYLFHDPNQQYIEI